MNDASTKIMSIFCSALERAHGEDRGAYLLEACAGDAELRSRLDALLLAHENAGGFLKIEPNAGPAPGGLGAPAAELVGSMIGPYKLLKQIGEGGMGTVYLAEQDQPVRRRVALKVVKPGMDSVQVLARFGAERQALALMEHPNIARVIDGGATDNGRPYFVMELVDGLPITDYCDANQLTPQERLALFIPVCQAIQHAHHKGIIHRDIKPSNVLVTLHDGQPVPKVIDFGVAKAVDQHLTERTLFTEHGQIVGTLEYMSPEQAEVNGLDLDTRTDIYSLGVLAYELLTGSTPLERKRARSAALDEILRLIREEDPPRPSNRLSDASGRLAAISSQRKSEPTHLIRLVRGELDWILMKALEKDRTRRYATANDLAQDIARYLNDQPVEACPPSARYRLGKFYRRNKAPLLAAMLVVLALVGGIIGTTWGMFQAMDARQAEATERRTAQDKEHEARAAAASERQARTRESEQRQRAEDNAKKAVEENQIAVALQSFLLRDLLAQADPDDQAATVRLAGGAFGTKENPTIKELMDRAATELAPDKLDAKFPNQKKVQAQILGTVGRVYTGIGEYEKAVEFLARASVLYGQAFGPEHLATLVVLDNLAGAYQWADKPSEAIARYEELREVQLRVLGPDHQRTLLTLHNLGTAYFASGELARAVERMEQARAGQLRTLGVDHRDTLSTLHSLATLSLEHGKVAEALEQFQSVLKGRTKSLGPDHPDTLETRSGFGQALVAAGQLTQGIKELEQVHNSQSQKLGDEHPWTLKTLAHLGGAYSDSGAQDKAITILEQVRDVQVKKLGPEHRSLLNTLNRLATAYQRGSRLADAIELYEQIRDVQTKKLGADHPATMRTMFNLSTAYYQAGKLPQAIALSELVRDAFVKHYGPDHPDTIGALSNLAIAYQSSGKQDKAIGILEQVRDATVRVRGPEHPTTLIVLTNLGNAYQAAGKPDQALLLLLQAARGVEKLKFQHPYAGQILGRLIACHEELRQYAEAEQWLRILLTLTNAKGGIDTQVLFLGRLGRNLLKQQKVSEAEQSLRDLLALADRPAVGAAASLPPSPAIPFWQIDDAKSMLGEALIGQKRFAEAEVLLLASYQDMAKRRAEIPPASRSMLGEAQQRILQLYDAWDKKEQAADWRKKFTEQKEVRPAGT